jgi:VanZ family protein
MALSYFIAIIIFIVCSFFSLRSIVMVLSPNFRKLFTAILWLVFVSYLFCLPGAAIPTVDWMSRIWFDKWVHFGFFTGIVFLWSRALQVENRNSLLILLILVWSYGLLVEVVQDRFISNRSFDWGDWLADFVGSLAGLWIWLRYIKI